jgi:hypothetical protein
LKVKNSRDTKDYDGKFPFSLLPIATLFPLSGGKLELLVCYVEFYIFYPFLQIPV